MITKLFENLRRFFKESGIIESFIIIVTILCLLLNNYIPENWLNKIVEARYQLNSWESGLLLSASFSLIHLFTLFIIPVLSLISVRFFLQKKSELTVFPKKLTEFGLGWNDQSKFLWVYIVAYFVLLPFLVWVGKREEFQQMYPFFFFARYDFGSLFCWWLLYGLYYLGVEFFFRGFLVFGLFPKIGSLAIFVATIPYVMVHFAKPPFEAFGSVFAGLFLCYMALRSRSIWGGFFIHWFVGITMDAISLYFSGGFINY